MLKHLAAPMVGLATALISNQAVAVPTDNESIAYLVKLARDHGYAQCETGVRETFSHAGGSLADNVRTVTEAPAGMDTLKITAVYGDGQTSVVTDAVLMKTGKKCFIYTTTTLAANVSCAAFAAQSPQFAFQSEQNGVVLTENKGGVWMLLQPVGSLCSVRYQSDNLY